MFLRILFLFVAVPFVELVLLLQLSQRVGWAPTVALILFTGALGAALTRSQGLSAWRKLQTALAEGRAPHRELFDGVLILVAGAVLLTPGLLTDIAGFLLLVPPIRGVIRSAMAKRMKVRVAAPGPVRKAPRGDGGVIDVDFEEVSRE